MDKGRKNRRGVWMMLRTEFRKDRYHNYLVVCAEEGRKMTYQDEMIRNNSIRGFLPVKIRFLDNRMEYYYDITGAQSIALILEKKQLSYVQIKKILYGISQAIRNSEEYLLEEKDFMLSMEEIYLDLEKEEVKLCFYPGYGKEIMEQLHGLLESMMDKVAYEDKDAVLLIYSLYMKSGEKEATLESLFQIIEGQEKRMKKEALREETDSFFEENEEEELEAPLKEQRKQEELEGLEFRRIREKEEGVSENNESDNEKKRRERAKRDERAKRSEGKGISERNEMDEPSQERGEEKNAFRMPKQAWVQEKETTNQWNWKRQIIAEPKDERDRTRPVRMIEKPFVTERLDDEEEVSYFEVKYYLMAAGITIAGILIVFLLIKLNVLNNAFGTKLDIKKVFGTVLVVGSAVTAGYLKLFQKENRSTKMAKRVTYVDPDIKEARIKPDVWNGRDGILSPRMRKQAMLEEMKAKSKEEEKQEKKIEYEKRTAYEQQESQIAYKEEEELENRQSNKEGNHSNKNVFVLAEQPEHYEKTKLLAKEEDLHHIRLVPREKGKYDEMVLKNFPYFIGKHKSFMDYNLAEETISRFHAKIEKRNENVVLIDLNSTNGTFVNGRQLVPEEPEILADGDDVSFSNIHYIFTCPSENAVI